jgi:hypothetical protein
MIRYCINVYVRLSSLTLARPVIFVRVENLTHVLRW